MMVHAFQPTAIESTEPYSYSSFPALKPHQAQRSQRKTADNGRTHHRFLLSIFARLHKIPFGIHGWNCSFLIFKAQSQHLCQMERMTARFLGNLLFATESIGDNDLRAFNGCWTNIPRWYSMQREGQSLTCEFLMPFHSIHRISQPWLAGTRQNWTGR